MVLNQPYENPLPFLPQAVENLIKILNLDQQEQEVALVATLVVAEEALVVLVVEAKKVVDEKCQHLTPLFL